VVVNDCCNIAITLIDRDGYFSMGAIADYISWHSHDDDAVLQKLESDSWRRIPILLKVRAHALGER